MAEPAVRLQLATAADVPALAGLSALAARTMGPQVYAPEQVPAWESFGQSTPALSDYIPGGDTRLAEGDGTPGAPLSFWGIDQLGEVHSLYVHPAAGRRGLGRQLATHVMARAAERHGVQRLTVWATPFSRPLFEGLGFTLVEVRREAFRGIVFNRFCLHRP